MAITEILRSDKPRKHLSLDSLAYGREGQRGGLWSWFTSTGREINGGGFALSLQSTSKSMNEVGRLLALTR